MATDDSGGMLGSYKFKAMLATMAFLLVPLLSVVYLAAAHVATMDHVMTVIVTVSSGGALNGIATIVMRGVEGYAEKRDTPTGGQRSILAGNIERVEQVAAPAAAVAILALALATGAVTGCAADPAADTIRRDALIEQPSFGAELKACVDSALAADAGNAHANACKCDVERRHGCASRGDCPAYCVGGSR